MENNIKYINGLFLLLLILSESFVAYEYGYKLHKLLQTNPIFKHILIIILIYFSVDITSKTLDNPRNIIPKTLNNPFNITSETLNNPLEDIKKSIIIWFCFIIFIKMNIFFISSIFIMLTIQYIVNNYKNYLNRKPKNIYKVKKLDKIKYILKMILIILIVVGLSTANLSNILH